MQQYSGFLTDRCCLARWSNKLKQSRLVSLLRPDFGTANAKQLFNSRENNMHSAAVDRPMRSSYPRDVLCDIRGLTFASFLDLSRWSAACIVFLGHLRDPLFLGYSEVATRDRNLAIQLWYFVTGWHGEAVIIFFVISGYLVGGVASARASVGKFSSPDYAIDRCTRLYFVLLPALVLTAALDYLGATYLGAAGLYTHEQPMIVQKIATQAFSNFATFPIFVGNVFMLQTIACPSFGSNQPLWTISLEFWFYVVFGLMLLAWLSSRQRWVWAAALLILFALLGTQFPFFLGLWLCGVAVAFVPWRKAERPVIALLVFCGVLVGSRLGQDYFARLQGGLIVRNYLTAIAFAWLVVSMRSVTFAPLERSVRINRFLADFSYSLYAIHFPLMLFLLSSLYATGYFTGIGRGYSPTDHQGLLVYGFLIAAVYTSAWTFSQVTERQTWRARGFLKSALGTRLKHPSASVTPAAPS